MISAINLHRPLVQTEIPNFRFQPLPPLRPAFSGRQPPRQIAFSRKKLSDADLASDLATEVAKIEANLVQSEAAMKKSRELLFTELCGFLGLKSEETKRSWNRMDEEARSSLVKEFVSEWGFGFQPLSSRSVKEMVEKYVAGEDFPAVSSPPPPPPPSLISSLKKSIGL